MRMIRKGFGKAGGFFKGIWKVIKTGIGKVKSFFKEGFRIFTTPFKELSWSKRIIKAVEIGVLVYLVVALILMVITIIATIGLIGGFIFSLGGAIEGGGNEMLGRNKRNRYY